MEMIFENGLPVWLPFEPEAVVLANGAYPEHPCPLKLLYEAPYVVCCDGAADAYIYNKGVAPDLIIGDGDSVSAENRIRYADRFRHNPDQETNDQTKAVEHLRAHGFRRILIVGATGKREDHTLGNISLLADYARAGAEVAMATDYGIFVPACHTREFRSYAGQQVSVFSFGATGLEADGLAYPLRDFNSWWQGTLNEATGERFVVRCRGEYIVYLCYC